MAETVISAHQAHSTDSERSSRLMRRALLSVCVLLSVWSVLTLLADVFAHQATRYERRWYAGQTVTATDWLASERSLQRALLLSPFNPDYLQARGRLATWSSLSPDADRLPPPDAGLPALRTSLQLRPRWPYAWAELAMVKALAGEFDAEFERSLARAERFGPWERPVITRLLTIYFQYWSQLTPTQQMRALDLLARAVTLEEEMVGVALTLGLNSPLMPDLCEVEWVLIEQLNLINLCAGSGVLQK